VTGIALILLHRFVTKSFYLQSSLLGHATGVTTYQQLYQVALLMQFFDKKTNKRRERLSVFECTSGASVWHIYNQ
jgi:hypothetical protein